ncbi:MAG: hypothetical protein EOM59_15205 [Clostridia bacterium]|nr:hypothetical protein [Clostridia bacterium]
MSKYIKSIKIAGIGVGLVACCAIFAEPPGCFVDKLNACNPLHKVISDANDPTLSCYSNNYPGYSYAYAAPGGASGYNGIASVSQSCTWTCEAEDEFGEKHSISESGPTPQPATVATGDECEVPWPPSL